MHAFYSDAKLELETVEALHNQMKVQLKKCYDYFAEPDLQSSEDLFAVLNDFLLGLKVCSVRY